MGDYIEITIAAASRQEIDILVALLADMGFEGFEESPKALKAYIPAADFDEAQVAAWLAGRHAVFTTSVIPETNWNATWEAAFEPVVVEGFCGIRAAFHPPVAGIKYDLVITPKMSFGTGHHATTYLMIAAMEHLDLNDKTVADFGTGTGVLAILAAKMGAIHIDALDNDDWSISNGQENIRMNACTGIRLFKAGSLNGCGRYHCILANINRNVILNSLPELPLHLLPGGLVLVSGILEGDVDEVVRVAAEAGLQPVSRQIKNSWACIRFCMGKD